jgi:hypothetical protein
MANETLNNTTPTINFELTPLEEAWMSALTNPVCGVVQCVTIQCACCSPGKGLPPCPSGEEA